MLKKETALRCATVTLGTEGARTWRLVTDVAEVLPAGSSSSRRRAWGFLGQALPLESEHRSLVTRPRTALWHNLFQERVAH